MNYLFIIILIGFISSCSTKRDKPIQEGNLETIRFDENQVRELPFSFFVDTIELIPLETTEEYEIIKELRNHKKLYKDLIYNMNNTIKLIERKIYY